MVGARWDENSQWKTIKCFWAPEFCNLANWKYTKLRWNFRNRTVLFLSDCVKLTLVTAVKVVENHVFSVEIDGSLDVTSLILVGVSGVDYSCHYIRLCAVLKLNKGLIVNVLKFGSTFVKAKVRNTFRSCSFPVQSGKLRTRLKSPVSLLLSIRAGFNSDFGRLKSLTDRFLSRRPRCCFRPATFGEQRDRQRLKIM